MHPDDPQRDPIAPPAPREAAPAPAAAPAAAHEHDFLDKAGQFLRDYAWFIVRNLIGWILILASPVLGALIPGPGGLPVFLIGFALVTFPGKRKLTARVLRGRRLHIEDRAYAVIAAFLSIVIPGIALWIVAVQWKYEDELRRFVETYAPANWVRVLTVVLVVVIIWGVTRLSLKILNGLLRLLPKFRRKFRPWLKRQGLKLLPPRRRRSPLEPLPPDEILELDPHHQHRIREAWRRMQPWVKRAAALAITAWIVAIMIRPLTENWPDVRERVAAAPGLWWKFLLASVMFAVFLLCFRAFAWRRALKGFGYKLPYGAAARIWSTSELARYLPGAIWQVVGRVFMCRPYGIPGSIVSTSQLLEVGIFLMANVLVATACLLYFGQKIGDAARPWLITALALVPLLGLLLHPRIFYGVANSVLRKLGKPTIVKRLRGRKLVELLGWVIVGLVLQSLAVYLITDPVLGLKIDWWWVVAGAYCLAWCAGFLAFWAPGGIGVRELVFVTTMQVILPDDVRAKFDNPATLGGVLVLLGFLLRLWTVVGELLLTGAAHAWDYRGAMNLPGAPGQVPPDEQQDAEENGDAAVHTHAASVTDNSPLRPAGEPARASASPAPVGTTTGDPANAPS